MTTTDTMTSQEVFDTVVRFLRKQGRPAREGDKCKYRLPLDNGTTLMCAVGCLIRDDEYSLEMEGLNVWSLQDTVQMLPKRLKRHQNLLSRLQEAHDDWRTDKPLPVEEFRDIANFYNLSAAALEG